MPDELGAFAVARFLAGHESLLSMRDMPHYSLVPGVVLTPLAWIGLGTVAAYKSALVLTAAMTLGAAALLRRAVQIVAPDRELVAAVAFAVVVLFPATFVTGSFTWAEPSVLLTWAVLLWSVARCAGAATPGALVVGTVVGSVAAGLAPFVHGRLTAIPVVWVAALLAWGAVDLRRGRVRRCAIAAMGVALTTCVALAARALDHAVTDAVWTDPSNSATDAMSGLVGTEPWWRGLGAALLGQGWVVLASTAGLALLGAWWLLRHLAGPAGVQRRFAAVAAAMLASTIAISLTVGASGLSSLYGGPSSSISRLRWDHLIHGRYLDSVALVLTVLGVAVLLDPVERSTRRLLAASAAVVGAGALALWALHHRADLADSLDLTIAGVAAIWPGGAGWSLVPWTVWPLATIGALIVASTRGRHATGATWPRVQRRTVAILGAWLLVGVLAATALVVDRHIDLSQPDLVSAVGAPQAADGVLIVADDVEPLRLWRFGVHAQQRDLLGAGWTVAFDRGDSADLAADPDRRGADEPGNRGADVEGLILLDGVEPASAGWTPVVEFGGATIWRR